MVMGKNIEAATKHSIVTNAERRRLNSLSLLITDMVPL